MSRTNGFQNIVFQETFPPARLAQPRYHKRHPQDTLRGNLEKGVIVRPVAPVTVVERVRFLLQHRQGREEHLENLKESQYRVLHLLLLDRPYNPFWPLTEF